MTEEEKLLTGLRAGENETFRVLYREYFGMVRHLVVKNSGSDADAMDVFQEGVIALYEMAQKPGFRLTASLKTLLYSICRNQWLKKLRTKGKTQITDFEKAISLPVPDEEEDLTAGQLKILSECFVKLGESCRHILERYYYRNQSMEQIAQEMGYTNADTVKTQKYKCMQQLKKLAHAA